MAGVESFDARSTEGGNLFPGVRSAGAIAAVRNLDEDLDEDLNAAPSRCLANV
jgi:hypothetical protein